MKTSDTRNNRGRHVLQPVRVVHSSSGGITLNLPIITRSTLQTAVRRLGVVKSSHKGDTGAEERLWLRVVERYDNARGCIFNDVITLRSRHSSRWHERDNFRIQQNRTAALENLLYQDSLRLDENFKFVAHLILEMSFRHIDNHVANKREMVSAY
ncbi:hypothetical protein J6590_026029 [Homalodisca vitripennis]|nr:hypothetical protein J6590_026029 [Homalodisca vitripennis]